ncbi:AAA family ATPase [Planctomycetota bacterium]
MAKARKKAARKKAAQGKVSLESNPFEPSASGAPLLEGDFWLPTKWKRELHGYLDRLDTGEGIRTLVIEGGYGSGKSYVLRWLERSEFPRRGVLPYYFENPEVKFYDLANSLLRRIGRKHFAKLLFELAAPNRDIPQQRSLFSRGFEAYMERLRPRATPTELEDFQQAIQRSEITSDDEIAYCLARLIVDTPRKPYFEYRDFVSTRSGSLAAHGQEAHYFSAIIKVLRLADSVKRVCFLLDEFEEISLQKRMTRRDSQDYLVTLRRLADITAEGELWLVLAMTPDAADQTRRLNPAFWDRCYRFPIPPLSKADARHLIEERIKRVSSTTPSSLFGPDYIDALQLTTVANPRRLVKVLHMAVAEVINRQKPLSEDSLTEIDQLLYPGEEP